MRTSEKVYRTISEEIRAQIPEEAFRIPKESLKILLKKSFKLDF